MFGAPFSTSVLKCSGCCLAPQTVMKQAVRINFSSRAIEITLWPLMALFETFLVDTCRPHQKRCLFLWDRTANRRCRGKQTLSICDSIFHTPTVWRCYLCIGATEPAGWDWPSFFPHGPGDEREKMERVPKALQFPIIIDGSGAFSVEP